MSDIKTSIPIQAQKLDEILQYRRAIRKYTDEPIPEDVIQRSVERAILAPSSANMQFWEFYHIKSPEQKKELARLCFNQPGATSAKELMVVAVRRDKFLERTQTVLEKIQTEIQDPNDPYLEKAKKDYTGKLRLYYWMDPLGIKGLGVQLVLWFKRLFKPGPFTGTARHLAITANKNVALAAQNFMLSMTAEGYDTCPMEGFDHPRVKRFLGLPRGADICMVIGMGKRDGEGGTRPRARVSFEEVYFRV